MRRTTTTRRAAGPAMRPAAAVPLELTPGPSCRGPSRRRPSTAPRPAADRWSSRRTTTWMSPTSSSDTASGAARRAELSARLADVRQRIEKACATAGRDATEITLIAVTKTYPADDVRLLHEVGGRDFGEKPDQERAEKAGRLAGAGNLARAFIGPPPTPNTG